MNDEDDLVERFSMPRADLTPEVRQHVDAMEAWLADLMASGRIAPPDPMLDDDTVPGLDHTNGYRPFKMNRPMI
jgi:hypothetical protein